MLKKELAIAYCLSAFFEEKITVQQFVKLTARLDCAGKFDGFEVSDLIDTTESLDGLLG
jgi:hypothetical protein